jgi:hypothetical protein
MMQNGVVGAYSLACTTLDTFTDILRRDFIVNDFIHSYRADSVACTNTHTESEIDFYPMIRFFPFLNI